MKIGQVAADAGITVDTVRFYERRGVLPAPTRRSSGYREYTPSTVERIRMARALQTLGFTLDEVIEALGAHDSGRRPAPASCGGWRRCLTALMPRSRNCAGPAAPSPRPWPSADPVDAGSRRGDVQESMNAQESRRPDRTA